MLTAALLVGKFLGLFRRRGCRRAGISGSAALVLCPDLYERLRVTGRVVVVTGSNGKSSVASMIAHMLRAAGKRVVTNCEGAGRSHGAASVMVSEATLSGRIDCDFLVLEADGSTPGGLLSLGAPELVVVTDLLEDHGPVYCRSAAVRALLERILAPETKLLVNAMDPRCAALCADRARVCFGAGDSLFFPRACQNLVCDLRCPVCGEKLAYDYVLYHNVGKFRCGACGFGSPTPEYTLSDFSLTDAVCSVNGARFAADFPAVFHYMNVTAAAAAVCTLLGVAPEECAGLFAGFRMPETAFSVWRADMRRIRALFCREQNPVSYDCVLEYVAARPDTKTVVLCAGSGRHRMLETGWLYEVTSEMLSGRVESFVCTGARREDLAVRLEYAGVRSGAIRTAETPGEIAEAIRNTRGTVYVLAGEADIRRVLRAVGARPEKEARA